MKKRETAPKRRGHLVEVRALAMTELRKARATDNHIAMGLTKVPEEKLWMWFLRKLSDIETQMRRP